MILKTALRQTLGRPSVLMQKYSPELLLIGGTVSIIGGTVAACRATLKLEEVVQRYKASLSDIKEKTSAADNGGEYSEKRRKKDISKVYLKLVGELVELYGPSVLFVGGGIGMFWSSHVVISERYAGALAAYKLLDESFKTYRHRVTDMVGPQNEQKLRKKREKTAKDEGPLPFDPDPKNPDEVSTEGPALDLSIYAKRFDSESPQWGRSYLLNEFFLRAQQGYANDLLNVRGHVFLNEIYDALGLPRTKEGALVGWVKDRGDNYVSFGLESPNNDKNPRDENQAWVLDFNVSGVIYDLI